MGNGSDQQVIAFVGTYTTGSDSVGVYAYRMDQATGDLSILHSVATDANPTFLAIDRAQRRLFVVHELSGEGGESAGAVSLFDIDPQTFNVSLTGQQPTHGPGCCHVNLDATEQFVLTANYTGGNIAIYPLDGDGQLGPASATVDHHETGDPADEGKTPRAHCIITDPTNQLVLVCDLGLDKVMIYRLDPKTGGLSPHDQPWLNLEKGAGPRHLMFHPNGRLLFVINELDSTMASFTYDSAAKRLTHVQTLSTLPDGYEEKSYCADLHINATGQYLYGSNRGHDSLAIFKIDEQTGRLSLVGTEPTQGNFPRSFAIDPTKRFVLVANQNDNNIVVYTIDDATGLLTATGHITEAPMPVCIKMFQTT